MVKKTNVVNLATGSSKRKGRTSTKKTEEVVVVDNNQKAKDTVEKLLKDVPMDLNDKETLFELEDEKSNEKGDDWLQEQVIALSDENEKLRAETATAKSDYHKIHIEFQGLKSGNPDAVVVNPKLMPDSLMKRNVLGLFDELQKNMLGLNPEKSRYKEIKLTHLLKKMLDFFPFTNEIRKF